MHLLIDNIVKHIVFQVVLGCFCCSWRSNRSNPLPHLEDDVFAIQVNVSDDEEK
jgi:hypothetical protein